LKMLENSTIVRQSTITMGKFQPLGVSNLLFQIDGTKNIFGGLADAGVPLNSGFAHSSINRYMLTSNLIQYHVDSETPVVLDFGCGAGSFKSFWDRNFQLNGKKSLDYIGLEVTPSYIDEGTANGHVIRHFDANNQDIRDIELPCSVDVILMQQFVEHIDERALDYLLEYAYELLTKGGMLVVSSPDALVDELVVEHHHDKEYTFDEMVTKLESKGFKLKQRFGWLGHGKPFFSELTDIEKEIYNKLRYISNGYANSVMCMINERFAPYYYLVLSK